MITGIYFLVLLAAAVEDYRTHRIKGCLVLSVWLIGLIKIFLEKENRWVTLALTCVCFVLLFFLYGSINYIVRRKKKALSFGGADVRLIPGMMLAQGWDIALTGVFIGLLCAGVYYIPVKRRKREIPLVPWMAAGCFFVEIIYLFSYKSVI